MTSYSRSYIHGMTMAANLYSIIDSKAVTFEEKQQTTRLTSINQFNVQIIIS